MITTVRLTIAALFATSALSAQDVLISEVRADAGGRWIELHNRTDAPVDMGSWSLHYASHTPNTPQEYWWAFPLGTTLAANGYLRVFWFQAAPATPAAGDLFTGNTLYDFLFSLGGETLSGTRGALGLIRSQDGNMMSSPTMVEDWLSWGGHGFSREPVAIAAGLWSAGRHAPAIPAGSSLARNTATIGLLGFIDEQWFLDASPTPHAPNLSGAAVTSYGPSCSAFGHHLLGQPLLRAPSLPLLGNPQFRLAVDNTTGIYGEYVMVIWSSGQAPAGQVSLLGSAFGGCGESVDPAQIITLWLLPAQVVTTNVPLSLVNMSPTLVGSELHAQALVLDLLPFAYSPLQGLSNALRIVFGQ